MSASGRKTVSSRQVVPEETLQEVAAPSEAPALQGRSLVSRLVVEPVVSTFTHLKKIAQDDPRKAIHALKVGLGLTVTALYIMFVHSSDFVGRNGIWAIMTVVVISEFTAGACLSKGLNRAAGTSLAVLLVLGLNQLVMLGGVAERAVKCTTLFSVATVATFLRFIPAVKAKYDYGVLIFLLTFSFLVISTKPDTSPMNQASSRLYMVSLGACVSLSISTFICPIWAGEDLHKSVAKNFEKLANSLEGSVHQYFTITNDAQQQQQPSKKLDEDPIYKQQQPSKKLDEDPIYKCYRLLLGSSASDEAMAVFATWEPPHGKFKMVRYPWQHYIRVGKALRHCAYTAMALHGCLTSELQAPMKLRAVFKGKVEEVTKQSCEVLRELGRSLQGMQMCRAPSTVLRDLKQSAEGLQRFTNKHSLLFVTLETPSVQCSPERYSSSDTGDGDCAARPAPMSAKACSSSLLLLTSETTQSAANYSLVTLVSLLIETVARMEMVVEAVHKLGKATAFQAHPAAGAGTHDVVIQVNECLKT